jgi:ketosteroid isomerase-like protein
MRIRVAVASLLLLLIPAAWPQSAPPQITGDNTTGMQLVAMLNQFMKDATTNNAAGFDKFFADDVIYTRSAGSITTKAEIMKSLGRPRPAAEASTVFSAEDVTVHVYPDTAVVAFQLVSTATYSVNMTPQITRYRNTGVFLKRSGRWQVVAWQATKEPDANPGR